MRLRIVSVSVFAALGACVTAPTPPSASRVFADHLRLCPRGSISNAPEADGAGRVKDFSPFTTINGVTLARAPVGGCLSSGFGARGKSPHEGVDFSTLSPRPVFAAGDGVVVSAAFDGGYGKSVLVRHGRGVVTRYAHLSEFAPGLQRGERIRAGARIGLTGKTGAATGVHLHYEILVDGAPRNPLTVGR